MRTKTLLIAAAALAAGILASSAQTYSQNIVGYANVPTPSGGVQYLLTVPFTIGVSNGANEVWPLVGGLPTLPDGSVLSIWTGSGYDVYQSDSGSDSLWDNGNGDPIPNAPLLPVGKGFFLKPNSPTTNTFAGTVAVSVNASNKMSLPTGGANYLLGCVVPYAGAITNGNPVTGAGGVGLSSLNGLPDGSVLSIWTGSGYNVYQSDSGSDSFWDNGDGDPIPVPPAVNVGQGFFMKPNTPYTWTVGL